MPAERWRQVEEVFQSALECPPGERASFLATACGEDRTLRAEVDSLIAAHQRPNDLLETENFAAGVLRLDGRLNEPRVGRKVGPYTLLRELGRGGMSIVYLARRADRELERQVALKLVGQGNHPLLVRRFRTERRILATLDHPNVARLYDGGTTDDGEPYFVMEHVEGRPVDRYCDAERLGTTARLELFRQVCGAVQYAHQNLVVHRDIKPSNILVTADGTPKLLDFGIAKLLEPDASSRSGEATQPGLRPMTPRYASPEQLRGGAITTASDVYSLGVLLYKLLTGRLPYPEDDFAPESVDRHRAPPKPSVAAARTGEALRHRLAGDVDSIVLKALRWEPDQRYGSVEQLAEDVRRHLEGLPVEARRGGWRYRAGKFVRRNKLAVAAVAGFVALALASAVTMAVLTAQVVRERDRARLEQDRTSQVVTFLVDLFEVTEASGNTVSARELLDEGAQSARELDVEPQQRAALYDTLGTAYLKLGLFDSALPFLEEALGIRRRALGAEHLELAGSLNHLAELLSLRGEHEKAEIAHRDALAMRRKLLGNDHPEVAVGLNHLTTMLVDTAEMEEVEALSREAVTILRQASDEKYHADLAAALNNLASSLRVKNDLEAAELFYREALKIQKQVLGEEHQEIANTLTDLGMVLYARKDHGASERFYREGLEMRRELLGGEHPLIAWNLALLAQLFQSQGDYDAAEPLYLESLEILRNGLPEGSSNIAFPLVHLGLILTERGDPESAEPLLREALEVRRKALPESSPLVARPQIALGACLLALGEHEEASKLLAEGYRKLESRSGQREWKLRALRNLVELYQVWNKPEKADEYRRLLGSVESE